MDATTVAAITAAGSTSSLGSVATLLVVVILAAIPMIIKFWNWSKETSAQGMLYQQLSQTVQDQRKELDGIYVERTQLQQQLFELKHKVDVLEGCERVVDVLKLKLDEKDRIIADRDKRISILLEELLTMKDRVHNLELRLKADEIKFDMNVEGNL